MDPLQSPSFETDEEKRKEEHVKKLTPLAKDIVLVLVKTIKATKMYLPNNPIYQKFREELKEKFDAYFKDEEMLSFLVDRFDLTFLDQKVYDNPDKEDNIALMFFKDGVREFCFHKGITPEEIDGFIGILKFDARERELDDDLVTLMWERDFENITYTVTEEATGDEAAEEDVLLSFDEEPEALRQLDELRARAAAGGGDAEEPRQHAMSVPDAVLSVADVESADELEKMRGTYEAPDDLALLTELTDIFYEILVTETDRDHFEMVADSLSKALEIFVQRGDLSLATIIVMKLQELAAHPRLLEWRPKLDEMLAKASSEPIIKKVGEFIDQGGKEAMEAAGSYLMQLDQRAVGPTVKLLETLNNRIARKAVCGIIAGQCGGSSKPVAPFLNNRLWFVVRNIVMIMGKIADPESVEQLGPALRHEEPKVRREAVYALAAIKGNKAEDLLSEAVLDPDRYIRTSAAKALIDLAPDKAYDKLASLANDRDFYFEKEYDEIKEFYEVLGRAGGEKAVPFLAEKFKKKGFLGGQKRDRMRACAAYGLAAAGGEAAFGLLKSEIDSKSKALRAACLDGLRRAQKEAKP